MKFLKLGIIFAIFVGVIVMVMNWKSIVNIEGQENDYPKADKISIEEKCTNFRKQWASAKSWDKDLYERQSNQVKAWKGQRLVSEMSYNTLSTTVREQAISKITKSYKALLLPDAYNHEKLMAVYGGVKYIKANEKNSDRDFQEIDGIHSLYLKIRAFITSPHRITPTFDVETGQWSSFAAAQNKILSSAASYRNNRYYPSLKEIPGFQEGLNETSLRNQLNKEKSSYYASLGKMIAKAVDGLPATEENYNRMKGVYERFAEENSANSGVVYTALKNMKNNIPSDQ